MALFPGPVVVQVRIHGGVRIIILPCPNWSIKPNLGVIIIDLLVPLDPLGLIGPHVPVTRMRGIVIEANCH